MTWQMKNFEQDMSRGEWVFRYTLFNGDKEVNCVARGPERAVRDRIEKSLERLNKED